MKPRALTPVFRLLDCWFSRPLPGGVELHSAPEPGGHPGEAWFLAGATAALCGTAFFPLTESLGSLLLRLPATALLTFLLPHLFMAAISQLSPLLAGPRLSRELAQDWSCLALLTAWAAWRSTGSGSVVLLCQVWLGFAALNLLLLPFADTPPPTCPPAPSDR